MLLFNTHILWLYFGYFTSNQVQWEHAIKPLGKKRLLGQNRLGGYFTNEWIQGMCKTKYWRNYYLNNHPWWEGHRCKYEWVDTLYNLKISLWKAIGPCKSKCGVEAGRNPYNLAVMISGLKFQGSFLSSKAESQTISSHVPVSAILSTKILPSNLRRWKTGI